ncbi:MAG: gamma-glutamylcyclotransferase [Pirellulales bacterium]|nr:gamma-glutamylcyclotransferase [Pirellulales bacterium]
MNLFTYGSLMFPEIWKRIGVANCCSMPATLYGFARYRVIDTQFPGIVRAGSADLVRGRMYQDLNERTLARIDAYESDLYERLDVTVQLGDAKWVACQTYVIADSRRHILSDQTWDPTDFDATCFGF